MKYHVLDGVGTGFERHAVPVGCKAMHRRRFVKRVSLVDDGVDFLLRHIADIRLFFVRAAAAGSAGFYDIAACQQVGASQLTQLPRAVCRLKTQPLRCTGLNQIQMRAGNGGEAADEHARAFDDAGVDRITHGT